MEVAGGITAGGDGALMSAIFSPDRRHRYVLTDPDYRRGLFPSKRIALWGLHNPSIADGQRRDATSNRVNAFTKAWGYDLWVIVNPFAYVAQDKEDLLTCSDPVGPENDAHIRTQLARVGKDGIFIAGWGKVHRSLTPRIDQMMKMIAVSGVRPHHLGKLNMDGSPKHPLYLGGHERPLPL